MPKFQRLGRRFKFRPRKAREALQPLRAGLFPDNATDAVAKAEDIKELARIICFIQMIRNERLNQSFPNIDAIVKFP